MATNDVYELSCLYSVKGEKCANVLHFREVTAPSSDHETNLAEAFFDDIWDTAIKPALSEDATLQQIKVRRIHPAAGGPIIVVKDAPGTVAEDTLPPQSSVVIRKYSDLATKRGRGRFFLMGVPKTHHADGILLDSVRSLYEAICSAIIVNITEGGGAWQCCVWSKKSGSSADVTIARPVPELHTLRDRRMAAP